MKSIHLVIAVAIFCSTEVRSQQQLKLVQTVRQKGPVAYRDPFGSISPNGQFFAYSDLRRIVIQPIHGGGVIEPKKNGAFIRYLTWTPDNRLVTYELGGKSKIWYTYDVTTSVGSVLWQGKESLSALDKDESRLDIQRSELKELVWSKDGEKVAGKVDRDGETRIVEFNGKGEEGRVIIKGKLIESVQWNPARNAWAGIVEEDGKRFIDLNLGFDTNQLIEANCYGKIAFSNDGTLLYYAEGNSDDVLELWEHDLRVDTRKRLTSFSRDAYEPSISNTGVVVFKLQDYRINIATTPDNGGIVKTITSFQSEIPYWHPDGEKISFTYGSWRRVMDDANYPDIAQDLGVVNVKRSLPAESPDEVIRASYSEDQGMCWSPNKKWIAFHTHADGTDDIWLQPVGEPEKGKPLSKNGYETGWPRWSPDGKWIVSNTAYSSERINKLFLIGIDQETGKVSQKQTALVPKGLELGSFTDSQWTSDSKNLVVEYVVDEHNKELHLIPIDGSAGKLIHKFQSDQLYSGIGLSRDNQWVAYIAPDKKGNFQIFKVSIDGKKVVQVTTDPTDKAHPVYSPVDNQIAFSVFNYQSIFWMVEPD